MALIQVNALESRTFLLTCTRKLLILRLLSSRRATGSALPSIADLIADIWIGSFVPILLQKSFCTGPLKFSEP